MRQCKHDSEGTVEQEIQRMTGEMDKLQQRVEEAMATEDRLPRVGAHQITHPQSNDDELIVEVCSASGVEGKKVSERIAEQDGKEHNASGNPHRPKQGLQI